MRRAEELRRPSWSARRLEARGPVPVYRDFLAAKSHLGGDWGFEPSWLPDWLYPFQRVLVEWAVRKGRGLLAEDCGLGKTPQYFVWAENVIRHTNRPVLVLTPLGVAAQTLKEAAKFGVDCVRSAGGVPRGGARAVVTNYEKLHHFDPADFAGAVCDESSILKNFAGKRRAQITEFLRRLPYRLLCTATAAPNDYVELGTSSEALGGLGHQDMLSRFFKNDQNTNQLQRLYCQESKWRFRGHAEVPFWRWVCSWARACRRPSDLGFDDGPFVLPPLHSSEHIIELSLRPPGELYDRPAASLDEIRAERRATLTQRCEKAAELLAHDRPAVAWCNLNEEGDLLARLIPGAVQVAGRDSDEAKEEAFTAFAAGQIRALVTKPRIAAFGLNWQHCAELSYFPTHSYEEWYQLIRRFWRFGQTSTVNCHIVAGRGESGVLATLQRKSAQAERMFDRIVERMNDPLAADGSDPYTRRMEVPAWLS